MFIFLLELKLLQSMIKGLVFFLFSMEIFFSDFMTLFILLLKVDQMLLGYLCFSTKLTLKNLIHKMVMIGIFYLLNHSLLFYFAILNLLHIL